MAKYSAFIDETGDPVFTDGASRYFYVGAVLLSAENEDWISREIDNIKKKYGITELKSARTSDSRRGRILEDILELDFKLLTIEVHKEELEGEWFRFKPTFYKYIQKILIRQIYQLYGDVDIEVDRYGSAAYQASMQKYIQRDLQQSLFEQGSFNIGSAKINNLIQLSDFVTGTVRKIQTGEFILSEDLFRKLNTKWRVQLRVPETGSKYIHPLDEALRPDTITSCVDEAKRYLEQSNLNHDHPRILVLEYLYQNAIDDPEGYVYTKEIKDWLRLNFINLPDETFRSEVIASLRDEGQVIISSNKGYKLPTSTSELIQYIDFSSNKSVPQLKRLRRAIEFYCSRHDPTRLNDVLTDELKAILDVVRI